MMFHSREDGIFVAGSSIDITPAFAKEASKVFVLKLETGTGSLLKKVVFSDVKEASVFSIVSLSAYDEFALLINFQDSSAQNPGSESFPIVIKGDMANTSVIDSRVRVTCGGELALSCPYTISPLKLLADSSFSSLFVLSHHSNNAFSITRFLTTGSP